MVCCKCNRSSKCRQCICVKAGRKCSDCLPSRLEACRNLPDPDDNSERSPISLLGPTVLPPVPPTDVPHPALLPDEDNLEDPDDPPDDPAPSEWPSGWPLPTLEEPNFTWGDLPGADLCNKMREINNEVVHWRRNLFQIPSGSAGNAFVNELARLYQAYADTSSLESIALTACSVAPILLLQKPSRTSKSKDHVMHLQRRLTLWSNGQLQALLSEGRCIQKHLKTSSRHMDDDAISKTFSDLISNGKVRGALRFLSRKNGSGVLQLEEMVQDKVGEETVLRSVQKSSKTNILPVHHPSHAPCYTAKRTRIPLTSSCLTH